ncbi:MAG: disulfide bond formation protein B [Alphaproteobacteria bacterium]|nr:disulfide bond formation protein B [Alphaproteobacteria bacterium]
MESAKAQLFLIKIYFYSGIIGLCSAWIAEYIFDIKPCSLCLYQRYLLIIITFIAGSSAYILPSKLIKRMIFVTGLCFLIAAVIAFYHVGLEEKWFKDIGICQTQRQANSIEALRQQLLNAEPASCSQASWRLLGLSFAGYNLGFSSLMAFLGLFPFKFFKQKVS